MNETRASSRRDLRAQCLEFATGILGLHLPVDTALPCIDIGRPGRQFGLQSRQSAGSSAGDTLPRERAEFVLGDVEPTAMLRRLAEVKSPNQGASPRRRERLVKRADGVGIEVVAHDRHH